MENTLWVIPFSLGTAGAVFMGVAFYLRWRYRERAGSRVMAQLVGFRKLDNEYYIGAMQYAMGQGRYEDYSYNVQNSKPIFRFYVNGRLIEQHSDWSVSDLGKNDLGKSFPINYHLSEQGVVTGIMLEGVQYEQQRMRGRRIMFSIFAGMGAILWVFALLSGMLFL